jgi:hypothetical protein
MTEQKPKNWDPPPKDRTWYRCRKTGELAYLVTRDGRNMIRLNRPEEIVRGFLEADWIPEVEHRPITRAAVTALAYDADLKLCTLLGDFRKRPAWINLHEDVRVRWAQEGPPSKPPLRKDLFDSIMGTLERVSK